MDNIKQNDLSLNIRIPANKAFTKNVLLTLDGICNHFCFTETSRDKIKKALELVLDRSIEEFYNNKYGLFELSFTINENKLLVSVEDYLLNSDNNTKTNSEKVKNVLKIVEELTDEISFIEKENRNSCYSMSFNVSFIEDNV